MSATVPSGHDRPQTSPGPTTVATAETPLGRWNSMKTSNSNRYSARYSRGSIQAPQDENTYDGNRQSMKALAEFLNTREPPPTNWVSRLSDDEKSLNSLKKSAFRLFKKSKSKKEKPPRFLQLPDSAVAAKTRNGARHIAISIPIEHDHIEPAKKPAPLVQEQQQDPSLQIPSTNAQPDRSSVTILKPVVELRESGSSYLGSVAKSKKSETELAQVPLGARGKSPELHVDTNYITKDYFTGLETKQKFPAGESPPLDSARSPTTYTAVSPVIRQGSPSDPRHSGGTAYSTTSLGTWGGHSRGPSSVSTAPSATLISSLKLDLPPRKSSMSKGLQTTKAELIQTSKLINEVHQDGDPLHPAQSRASEATSQAMSTSAPPTVFSTAKAEIVRRYSGSEKGGPQIVRSITPKGLSPAPPKKLPDQAPPHDLLHPKTVPPLQARMSAMAQVKEADPRPIRDRGDETLTVARQSRQDRVKARKQRDIENLRGIRSPLSEATSANNTQITSPKIIAPPTKSPKRSIVQSSQELARRKAANTVTPIMLVANIAPFTGTVLEKDIAASRAPGKNSGSSTQRSAEHTPPRSLTSSLSALSDSDNTPVRSPRRRLPRSGSRRGERGERGGKLLSPTASMLELRRSERRMKRNVREREKELDVRLSRIERDNEMLMGVLSGIASGFGQLSRRVDEGAVNGVGRGLRRVGSRDVVGLRKEGGREKGLSSVEESMRELQFLAPSVSGESVKHVEDEFEEDDGGSILL